LGTTINPSSPNFVDDGDDEQTGAQWRRSGRSGRIMAMATKMMARWSFETGDRDDDKKVGSIWKNHGDGKIRR
jgi:hypothetical protein